MKYRPSKGERTNPIEPLCRKEAYFTLEDAQDMIRHINETRVTKNIRAYRCDVCGFWHLTSRGKEKGT